MVGAKIAHPGWISSPTPGRASGSPVLPPARPLPAVPDPAPNLPKIYLLPTRAGMPLLAVLLAFAYAALTQANAGAYLGGFMLAALVMASLTHTHYALAGLELRAAAPSAAVFCGQAARVPLRLANPTRRVRRAVLEVGAARRGPWRPADHRVNLPVALPAGAEVEVVLSLPTTRRGWLRLEHAALETTYPLGIIRGTRRLPVGAAVLVYPVPEAAGPGAPPPPPGEEAVAVGAMEEGDAGAVVGGNDAWAGLRAYRPGDPPGRVNWRASARLENSLLVNEWEGAAAPPPGRCWLRWEDAAPAGQAVTVEARLGRLCRWVLELEARPGGPAYGLRLPGGEEVAPDRGPAHRARCLGALALCGDPDA